MPTDLPKVTHEQLAAELETVDHRVRRLEWLATTGAGLLLATMDPDSPLAQVLRVLAQVAGLAS